MIHNFNNKNTKDIEMASESIIPSTGFASNIINKMSRSSASSVTNKHLESESFDTYLEKSKAHPH